MTHPIWRYLHTTFIHYPSFSSDGCHLAFLCDISGLPQVWRVTLPFKSNQPLWPDQLTFESDRVLAVDCSPAKDDGRLIFARDVGGNENAQLYLLSPDGAEETPLTDGYEGTMHLFGEWSADGQAILFAANRRHPGFFDLYLQPIKGPARLVWQNEQSGFLSPLTISSDGERAIAVRMASSFEHDLFEINLLNGDVCQLNPSDETCRYEHVLYAPDGKSLFLLTDHGSDFLYIAHLDLKSLTIKPLLSDEWDIELLTLSPDGSRLAYTVNMHGVSELRIHHLLTGETVSANLPDPTPGVIGFWDDRLSFSPDSQQLAFSFTSATRSSDLLLWDLEDNQVTTVTRASHGGLLKESFLTPELIHYPTFDHQQIPAWFYKPPHSESRPFPVIVYVHGGPTAQFRPYFHFFLQYFLAHGYAVLAPNVRGSTGYGKAYSHLDDVEKRMDSVADLAHAALWLKQQPDIDGDRLVVYGGSYGGFMVLAAMTHYPHLWAAGVDIVGISNFVTFLENTSEYRRVHREAEYGNLTHDRPFLESIAPIHHLEKIRSPLMVIHGANDPRVPLSEAEQLVSALKARHIPVEFLIFEDEGHGLAKRANKLVAYPAIVKFLETQLGR